MVWRMESLACQVVSTPHHHHPLGVTLCLSLKKLKLSERRSKACTEFALQSPFLPRGTWWASKKTLWGNSLRVQWLGFWAFHCSGPRIRSLGRELRSHRPHGAAKTKTNLFWDRHKAKLFCEVSEGPPLIMSISWISKDLCWYLSTCPCLSLHSPGSRSWDKDLNAGGFLWQVTPGTPVEVQAAEGRRGGSWSKALPGSWALVGNSAWFCQGPSGVTVEHPVPTPKEWWARVNTNSDQISCPLRTTGKAC